MPPSSLRMNIPSPSNQLATKKEKPKDQSDDVITKISLTSSYLTSITSSL